MPRFRTLEISDPKLEVEGLRFLTVKSPNLHGRGDITVYVPPGTHDEPLPIVTLLHGVYGSHWAWAFKGGAHRTAAKLIAEHVIPPMVLAMPSDGLWGDGSGYLPHVTGDYEAWIVDDVPDALVEADLPVASTSSRFIAGLSMGGFGALRLGVKYSSRYQAVVGMSAMTHLEQMGQFVQEQLTHYELPERERSIAELIIANKGSLPRIRFDCGIDDQLIAPNRELHLALRAADVVHEYEEHPGEHSWRYWAQHLPATLRFFAASLSSLMSPP